uniref:SUEL-type lectin domain-containing protein n=1 Tax=Poecilia reticulata TaxID=8081 RepID=A0A3P9N2E0_POERE
GADFTSSVVRSLVLLVVLDHYTINTFRFPTFLPLPTENGVIYVSSAKYGRRDRRTCSTGITDDQRRRTNCSTRANYVFRSCHGKSECSILVSSSVFGDPCIGTYKYLEVNYRCFSFLVTCEGSVSHIQCGKVTGVIFMISATYGRSDQTTCSDGIPDSHTKNTDCAMNTESVYESCHGKSECSVLVSSSVFEDPCVGTYKYLDLFYRCQK